MDSLPATNNTFKDLDPHLKAPAENQSLSKMVLKGCVISFSHSAETNRRETGNNQIDYSIDD